MGLRKTDKITLPIAGMSCASCASRIEKKLSCLKGVNEVAVNFATQKATLKYDPSLVTPSDFEDIIIEAGYKVIKFSGEELADVEKEERDKEVRILKMEVALMAYRK